MKTTEKNNKSRIEHLNKAVSIPPAQNDTLCQTGTEASALAKDVIDRVEHLRAFDLTTHIFAKTMLLGGLRVSEMLAVSPRDIDELGRIRIKSLKGGLPRLVDTGANADQFKVWRNCGYIPWGTWTRFFVYRQFKKYGIQMEVAGNEKKSVTHALRHVSAQVSATVDSDLQATKSHLGHKSISNTEIYAKSKSAKLLDLEGKTSSSKTSKTNRSNSKE
jgi:site-specific recombinase XerD